MKQHSWTRVRVPVKIYVAASFQCKYMYKQSDGTGTGTLKCCAHPEDSKFITIHRWTKNLFKKSFAFLFRPYDRLSCCRPSKARIRFCLLFIGHLLAFLVQKFGWGFRIWVRIRGSSSIRIRIPQQCWELTLIYEKCSVACLSGELWSHRNHPDFGDCRRLLRTQERHSAQAQTRKLKAHKKFISCNGKKII